ncbi:hypothetical protein SEA_FEDE_43 [Microbacterium phage Fede]|nr:hypothetical protein SEA_FEDE_43 [Microbacterium phage Fede]
MANSEVSLTLDEAVAEVMSLLVDTDLQLVPELDRYQSITRHLNRALRHVAREQEWSYYSSLENMGIAHQGDRKIELRAAVRPRIINDDAVRLVHPRTRDVIEWAYWIPRDALHKYTGSNLRAAYTRTTIEFSREFFYAEDGLEIHVPVMREPTMFRLPEQPENPDEPLVTVPDDIREQLVDFDAPDLVVTRAAYSYAQTNAMWQPRVQTLEATYKDLMYSLVERDTRNTDAPYQNEWTLGIDGDAVNHSPRAHRPSADWTVSY